MCQNYRGVNLILSFQLIGIYQFMTIIYGNTIYIIKLNRPFSQKYFSKLCPKFTIILTLI